MLASVSIANCASNYHVHDRKHMYSKHLHA